MRKQKINYGFFKIMTGSDLSTRRLAIMSAKSKNPGPVVWLTGCVHGDEVGGIAVIQEIFKKIRTQPLEKGSIFAIPLMNPMGFETNSRYLAISEEDLNRSFPGKKTGSLAERVADKIFSTIMETRPALVLDLHNDWIKSIPYVLIDPPPHKHKDAYDTTKKIAQQTGFLIINEQETSDDADELKKTLSGSLINQGIPALTLELGESYIIDEKNVKEGVQSIWNILAHLNMVKPPDSPFQHSSRHDLENKILNYSHLPTSSTSGIVRFLVKPGETVKSGQPIARVYNVFGRLEETITANYDAVLLGNSDSVVALPGVPLMAFGLI
ncbi:MAG TPA: M14 family metallopeptidase [bacterium]|nr:M14 family metallopeptidase [bacterium]HNS34153.1 M14 family metallopeptidase [bacterium]HNZ73135.1 M14 family metallopeptidase [bacterium]HOH67278.1 M14 family metallopeptidase [bacterium]